MTRVLVLMSRLSDYMLNCFTCWHENTGVELHVVHRKVDSAAPFQFDDTKKGMCFYESEKLDAHALKKLMSDIAPRLIICSGWMERDYLAVVRSRPSHITAVMTMDNQWLGTVKQHLGLFWSRFRLCPLFDYVWVPGPRQNSFARKLGFARERICEGLYVANAANFEPIWRNLKEGAPKKRLVFAGRYAEEKGLSVLWDAFIAYHQIQDSELELWCIGTGELDSKKPNHPKIKHLGFLQPSEFANRLEGGGVFILPSTFEPWGLVVQEFALAGFPLVLSPNVGAADLFLDCYNGLLLPAVSRNALIEAIAKIDDLSESELTAMSHASRDCAKRLDVSDWIRQASVFLEGVA